MWKVWLPNDTLLGVWWGQKMAENCPEWCTCDNVHNGSLSKCISFQHDCFTFISSCKRVVVACTDARIMQNVLLKHSRALNQGPHRHFWTKIEETFNFLTINCICRMFFAPIFNFTHLKFSSSSKFNIWFP